MQYGFWPSPETFVKYAVNKKDQRDPLKRVISWKSKVMAVKNVKPGEFIGYGQSYLARDNMRTAVVPVGYAHGYTRELSNQGRMLIAGKRVGVVGMINMNMLLVDITEVPEARVGDEVVLIGHQGDMEITVASFGELSNQLNYELLTRLPHNLPRIITE
jgi:alanine racemase